MKFTSYLFVSLTALAGVLAENSPDFTLRVDAPKTELDGFNLFLQDDGKLYLSATAETCYGYIHDNGSLILDSHVVGDGRNYLSTEAFSTAWKVAQNWTISSGVLKLYDELTFHAIPEGTVDGLYVLGTGNAVSSGDNIIEVKITPVINSSDIIIQSWPVEEGINALGTTVYYTQTEFAYMTLSTATAAATTVAATVTSAAAVANGALKNSADIVAGLVGVVLAVL